ncbi:MAG: hypothetical protein ABIW19_08505 [Vicinamibacterales bacterium]
MSSHTQLFRRTLLRTACAAFSLFPVTAGGVATQSGELAHQRPLIKVDCDSTYFQLGAGLYGTRSGLLATMHWVTPAAFPTASTSEQKGGTFAVVCPRFSAEQDFNADQSSVVFKIHGDSLDDIVGRLPSVQLLYWGEFRYPAIREGYNSNSTVAKIAPGLGETVVTFNTTNLWRDSVIAVRINDGSLRPAMFAGKASRIVIKTGERADFYIKAGPDDNVVMPGAVQIERFTIDPAARELTFWLVYPFPEK